MKGFFEEYQVKRYSMNDKIKWIFAELINKLNTIHKEYINVSTFHTSRGVYPNFKNVKFEMAFVPFKNINNIECPFKGFIINVNEKKITIKGENFQYEFPPEYILGLYNRLKKLK